MTYDLELGGNSRAMLDELAERQLAAEQRVAEMEKALDSAQRDLKEISVRQIPDALEELGLVSYETKDGLTIQIKEKIIAGLSEKNLQAGIKWLEENGLGRLVKRRLIIDAPKGSPELVEGLRAQAVRDLLEVEDKEAVHPTSLAAIVKRRLEDGEEVPLDLLGVIRLRSSKVSFKKRKP